MVAHAKLPAYVRPKRLKDKTTAYYWELPTWAKPPATRHGRTCPIESQTLGTKLPEVIEKADHLNAAFEDWRLGVFTRLTQGSVAWLFHWYRGQERFKRKAARTRKDYLAVMDALCAYPMKIGTFGERRAGAVDATTVDTLYQKLQKRSVRRATYAMQVCRLVWNWAVRHGKVTGVSSNPFAKMALNQKPGKGNRPTTRAEYDLYRKTAHDLGHHSMAAAAALIFELCQRVSDCFGYALKDDNEQASGFFWEDYKPGVSIALTQSKTGKHHVIPLTADDAAGNHVALYPDLEAELARLGGSGAGLIVLRDSTGEPYTERTAAMLHRAICDKAGLPNSMTLTGFRHGGTTEIGDTGEADLRAITGQKHGMQIRGSSLSASK